MTKKEVLERIREIAHGDEAPQKEEVDSLKAAFYKLHIAEREARLKEYIDGGGDPEQYQITPDEMEEAFKAEMGVIKEKRQKLFKEQEQEKQENLEKKLAIIEKIKAMITSPEEANKSYKDFKALQDEWREIKTVPAERANELWRNYQLYVEQFYDLLKLNSEAREYDFKKNLELKTKLCEAAEKLADEPDIISAFHQLQKLHQEYREIGPVSKELRDEIWNRFKAASTVINKRHQQHFEGLRAKEEDNLAKKTALCEKVEAIAAEENKSGADWERRTKEIIDIQSEWKTIGFAPQKMNVKIFERFRAACDDFFGRKAEYFRSLKDTFKENAEKKRALIEKAKALQDSTDWKSTGDKLINLQKEWKTIGMVPKKLGDQLWEEFLGACNKFFEARKAAGAGSRSDERENLEKKRDVIAHLKSLDNYSEGMVKKLYAQVKLAYSIAALRGLITDNFMEDRDMKCPKIGKPTKKVYALTSEQQKKFVETIESKDPPHGRNDYRIQLMIELYSGMRMGEINALRREDIDFDNNVIHVRRTISRGMDYRDFLKDGTKTDSGQRDIPISTKLKPYL